LKDIIDLSKNGSCTLDIIRCYVWLYSKLFLKGVEKPSEEFMMDILHILLSHLYIKDNEVMIATIDAINNIIELDYDNIDKKILDSGIVVKILSINACFNTLKKPIATFFGNMTAFDKSVTEVLF
jgi:hypothetical protein